MIGHAFSLRRGITPVFYLAVAASDGGPRLSRSSVPGPLLDRRRGQGCPHRPASFRGSRTDLPQFEGKAWLGRVLAYPISALIVPVAWLLVQRRRGRPVDYPFTLRP
jgi:hypothetical protein